MNQSPKMLMVVSAFAIAMIAGLVWMRHGTSAVPVQASTMQSPKTPFDVASGDTNNEVLRTLIASQQRQEKKTDILEKENKVFQEKNKAALTETVTKTQKTFQEEMVTLKTQFQSQIADQQKLIHQLNEQMRSTSSAHSSSSVSLQSPTGTDMIQAIEDIAGQWGDAHLISSQESLPHKTQPRSVLEVKKEDDTQPYYTLPANSTLNDVALMTSIIAEVPVQGKLKEPAFPFKAIIGHKDLFAANGYSLPPSIAGIVVSGYSVGNMTMSCARAYVMRILFVFDDGHFVVFPEKSDVIEAMELYPKEALGYLSDQFGNTCIAGQYITDAQNVVMTDSLLGAVSSTGEALSQSQLTTSTSALQNNSQLTGSMAKYMGGAMLRGSSEEALNFYKTHTAGIFDAVYIPASQNHQPTQLVLNLTQTIAIDWKQHGRTLRYDNESTLSHTHQLD